MANKHTASTPLNGSNGRAIDVVGHPPIPLSDYLAMIKYMSG